MNQGMQVPMAQNDAVLAGLNLEELRKQSGHSLVEYSDIEGIGNEQSLTTLVNTINSLATVGKNLPAAEYRDMISNFADDLGESIIDLPFIDGVKKVIEFFYVLENTKAGVDILMEIEAWDIIDIKTPAVFFGYILFKGKNKMNHTIRLSMIHDLVGEYMGNLNADDLHDLVVAFGEIELPEDLDVNRGEFKRVVISMFIYNSLKDEGVDLIDGLNDPLGDGRENIDSFLSNLPILGVREYFTGASNEFYECMEIAQNLLSEDEYADIVYKMIYGMYRAEKKGYGNKRRVNSNKKKDKNKSDDNLYYVPGTRLLTQIINRIMGHEKGLTPIKLRNQVKDGMQRALNPDLLMLEDLSPIENDSEFDEYLTADQRLDINGEVIDDEREEGYGLHENTQEEDDIL